MYAACTLMLEDEFGVFDNARRNQASSESKSVTVFHHFGKAWEQITLLIITAVSIM
jgi:hypothetical protein